MIKYKGNFRANNRIYFQTQIDECYNQENEENYSILDNYIATIDNIQNGFEDNNFNLIYELLPRFRNIFKSSVEKISIENLRISEVIQLLIEILASYLSDNFSQLFLESFFKTINHILYLSKLSHPFQLFTESCLFQILLDITNRAENNLLYEIILFIRLILDETQNCLDFAFQIINLDIFREIIKPTLENSFDEKTFIEYVHLIFDISKQPYNKIEGLEEDIFLNATIFIEFGNIEAIKNGYNIISNITNSDDEVIKNLVEQSENLSNCVERHLHFDIDKNILIWLIKALGNMCHWSYNLHLYKINPLIQFLDYKDVNIINLTSYALCNALKDDKNKIQFSQEDCFGIFNKLCELIQDSCFGLSSYIGETIPKFFKTIPNQYYQDLVQRGIFNIFQQIATIDTLMISNAEAFFDAIDQLFFYAESNHLLDEFTDAFMNSDCYSTIADVEIDDDVSNANEIRERIGLLLRKFENVTQK